MTRDVYHHGNLRAELLAEAWEAVEQGGWEALSVRALARRSGVSHSASARHFADKQALADALATIGFERLGVAVRQAGEQAPAQFGARFRAVAHAYVDFAVAHPAILALMYRTKHGEGASEALRAMAHDGMRYFTDLVAAAATTGEIDVADPEEAAAAAFAAVHGVASLATGNIVEARPTDAAVNAVVTYVLRGFGARSPATARR